MRARVAGATLAPSLKQRDTADWDTPAFSATSYEVGERFAGLATNFKRSDMAGLLG